MAAICTGDFAGGNGRYLIRASLSGAPNLRASSTICVRVKNSSTSTTIASVVADFCNNALTSAGAVFGRNSGVASTAYNTYRGGGSDIAARSTCYGNTTTWYHCTLVYNATTQMIRFYIDGVFIGQQSSVTTTASSSTANSFIIGWHPGKYADAAIWNRALTDQEVADQAAYRVCQVTSGLLGFWRLDSNGNDSSGNSQTFSSGGTGTAVSYSTSDNPPQPEDPPFDIDAAGSCSTSGTVNVTRVYSAASSGSTSTSGAANLTRVYSAASNGSITSSGAATVTSGASAVSSGSTSTSGTANLTRVYSAASAGAVTTAGAAAIASAAPLAGAGASNTKWTWADLVPYTGRAYRIATGAVTSASAATGASGSANKSICGWVRYYALQDTSGSNAAQLLMNSVGGAQSAIFSMGIWRPNGTPRAFYSAPVGGVSFTNAVNVDYGWHHLALTYDGTNIRFYVDGSLALGPVAQTFPFDDTSWNSFVFVQAGVYADLAHFKAWAGYALSAGDVTNEMNSYAPVTSRANLRCYYPLLWDNPGWDGSGNGFEITSGLVHSLDDAPNGPPGSWPESTASGSTSTSGTAAVGLTYSVASSGSTATTGAANVGISYAIAAASSVQTAGTAAVTLAYGQAASGQVSTAGAATATSAAPLAASAQTSTSGAAAVSANTGYDAASSGQTSTSGTVVMTATAILVANGQTVTGPNSGSFAGTLICSGSTASSGAAGFGSAEFPATSSGSTSTSGSAVVAPTLPTSAAGETSTSGTVTMTAAANLVAAGVTSTDGVTRFALIAGGLSQTSGAAALSASASAAASGSTATTGAAALGLGIVPGGLTSTSGVVTMTASAPLQAAGSSVTTGNAAFAGVAPPAVSGGGTGNAARRGSAVGGGRRHIR